MQVQDQGTNEVGPREVTRPTLAPNGASYAGGLRIVDADSHLMEWPRFLTDHADPSLRDAMPEIGGGRARLALSDGSRDAAELEELVALGGDLIRKGPKWHAALGAVDPAERSTALDLLGFEHQVIYSSLSAPLFEIADPAVRYGAYRAHNRAMAGFCADDDRLLGVALCDLDDPERSVAELEYALDLGLREVWVPARAPGGRSPGHVDQDSFWARLAERRVPFVLHVGSGALGVGDEWLDNGRSSGEAEEAGAEIIGARDFMTVYQPVERFLSALIHRAGAGPNGVASTKKAS